MLVLSIFFVLPQAVWPADCGPACGPQCDYCWFGRPEENNCPPEWCGDGDCDCGCQFNDTDCPGGSCDPTNRVCPNSICETGETPANCPPDCGGSDPCGAECDFCWVGCPFENNCPAQFCADGECDCGCQFSDADCPGGSCFTGAVCPDGTCQAGEIPANCPPDCISCGPQCDFCFYGHPVQNNCPQQWCGDGGCDCGCQFTDSDCPGGSCPPTGGACCDPYAPYSCSDGIDPNDCFGHYAGDGSSCATTDCDRCDNPVCDYCWTETRFDNDCDPEWYDDGRCDCGCQFIDVDCPNCPVGVMMWVYPTSVAIDARRPHAPGNPALAEGFQTFMATGPAGAQPGCWTLCEQNFVVGPNSIGNVVEGPPGTYTITLSRPITVGATTTLTYSPSGGSASTGVFISHPANVNGDSNATHFDVMELVDHLKGMHNPPLQLWQCDGDRSNQCTSEDVLTEIDLLNGAGLYTPWNGDPKPASSCP